MRFCVCILFVLGMSCSVSPAKGWSSSVIHPAREQQSPDSRRPPSASPIYPPTYACPMHPEVRSGEPGKCSKCLMPLAPLAPPIAGEFDLRVTTEPATVLPQRPLKLRFVIVNPRTGEQTKDFIIMHDELFHLFIVSQNMTHFQHIHPRVQPDGSFVIETVLPEPGAYKLYADFFPAEGVPQVLETHLVTAGYQPDLFTSIPQLVPDTSLTRVADGMKIALTLDPPTIIAGRVTTLKYHLTDEKTGHPVTDLRPYLAAWGHTLILSADQSDYLHSHPTETVPDTADRESLRGGPDVTFEALFPRPGIYRIWSQFLRGDRLTTVSFTVRAERLR
jgi:hypothetical protein